MNKTKISATIIADSKNEFGQRLITYVLVFPRIILAELNTHRMFSRNSASSRAIPFKKMLERVQNDPFIPIAWQKDHSGMQGTEYFTTEEAKELEYMWLSGRSAAAGNAYALSQAGATKQLCNRGLETYMWHTAIVTATEYENFFALRCPQYELNGVNYRTRKDYIYEWNKQSDSKLSLLQNNIDLEMLKRNKGQGEIHIMALAEAMWDAQNESTPKVLKAGEWHIPFGDQIDSGRLDAYLSRTESDWNIDSRNSFQDQRRTIVEAMRKIAAARCARISYNNFDGSDDYEKDIALYDRLAASGHMSPFEHVAKAMSLDEYHQHVSGHVDTVQKTVNWKDYYPTDDSLGWCGNFRGFIQMRKMIPNENRTV